VLKARKAFLATPLVDGCLRASIVIPNGVASLLNDMRESRRVAVQSASLSGVAARPTGHADSGADIDLSHQRPAAGSQSND